MEPAPIYWPDVMWAVGFALVATFLAALYSGPASGDDTFIFMRYVSNVLAGNGWVYNVGEASHGTTSVLWVAFMLPWTALLGNELPIWKGTGVVLFAFRAVFLWLLLHRAGATRPMALLVSTFVLLDAHTLRWFGSGMENSLTAVLFTLQFSLLVEVLWQRTPGWFLAIGLGTVSALLPFARPEFGLWSLMTAAILAILHFRRMGFLLVFGLTALIVGVTLLITTRMVTGFVLPQTGVAKGIFLKQDNPLYALTQGSKILISGAAGGLLLLVLPTRRLQRMDLLRLAVIVLVGVVIVYLATKNHLVSTRYGTMLATPVLLLGGLVALRIWSDGGWRRWGVGVALTSQVLLAVWVMVLTWPATRVKEEDALKVVGVETNSLVPAGSRVALTEIGVFGFYFDGYVIDMVGLVDPETVRWGKENGRYRNVREMEGLLRTRGATHHVQTFGANPITGETMDFVLLREWEVLRSNLSGEGLRPDVWRLYELHDGEGAGGSE